MRPLLASCAALLLLPLALLATPSDRELLFVHDDARQAEPLLAYLRTKGPFNITVVDQAALPADWSGYRAVLGYVHGKLLEPTELAIIRYTEQGGRFIALHHMISSGKAANKQYFGFLGMRLDSPKESSKPVEPGAGYGWYTGPRLADGEEAGISYTLVRLHPSHFIVTHDITWGEPVAYHPSDVAASGPFPAIKLPRAEAYMNHKFTDDKAKTILCGMKFTDPRTGKTFEQDRMAWFRDYGKGRIFYFQPGHFAEEYRNPAISQMVLNAVIWDGR